MTVDVWLCFAPVSGDVIDGEHAIRCASCRCEHNQTTAHGLEVI